MCVVEMKHDHCSDWTGDDRELSRQQLLTGFSGQVVRQWPSALFITLTQYPGSLEDIDDSFSCLLSIESYYPQ